MSIALLIATIGDAQDPRLAQPMELHSLLSPGAVGMGEAMRGALAHRARRGAGGVPFAASALTVDAPMRAKQHARDDARQGFGFGASVADERAGAPRMRSTSVTAALGYRVRMGAHSSLGGGAQLGLMQHWADLADGQWASQYNGLAYDPSLPSGERFGERPATVGDAAIGVAYRFRREGSGREGRGAIDLRAGIAGHHLNKPRLSLDRERGARLARRWSAFATGMLSDKHGRSSVEPMLLVSVQGRAFLAQGGSAYLRTLSEKKSFTGPDRIWAIGAGLFARSDGSGIVQALARFGEYGLGLAYELPLTAARRNALGSGVAELVLHADMGRKRR